jgi:hypothetical protein
MNLANNLENSAFYFPDRPAVIELSSFNVSKEYIFLKKQIMEIRGKRKRKEKEV